MSAEMFSGDIADFEAAAQRCPFLNSLGEQALAEIRADLAVSLATPDVVEEQAMSMRTVESPITNITAVMHRAIPKAGEASVPVPAAVLGSKVKAPEAASESAVLAEAVIANMEHWQRLEQSERLPELPIVVESPTGLRAEEPEPIAVESAHEQPSAVVAHAAAETPIAPTTERAPHAEESPLVAAAEHPIVVAESLEAAPVPELIMPREIAEITPELSTKLERLPEDTEAVPAELPTITELLVLPAELAPIAGETDEAAATEMIEPAIFLVKLEPLVAALPPERQATVQDLMTTVYELVAQGEASVQDRAAPEARQELVGELMEQRALVSAVTTVLQELGLEQPTEQHIAAYIALIYAEVTTEQTEDVALSSRQLDPLRERTGGTPQLITGTSLSWRELSQRLLARLALTRHLVALPE